jgi:hypothetical protein
MKALPDSDFRSRRLVLEPEDFALGPEDPDSPPSDLVDEETWRSMTSLQDDVSVRTSNEYGSALREMWRVCSEWSCVVGALQELAPSIGESPLCAVTCDVGDEFQASISNALVGFYRIAFSCLRNALENMSIGLELELSSDSARFNSWQSGDIELNMGWAADVLPSHPSVSSLEDHCKKVCADNFFRQRSPTDNGGVARRLFKNLSKFTHGTPGFTDAGMRDSNGPIFVPESFQRWRSLCQTTYALVLFEAKLGQPRLATLAYGSDLDVKNLFRQVIAELPSSEDGVVVLKSLPESFW